MASAAAAFRPHEAYVRGWVALDRGQFRMRFAWIGAIGAVFGSLATITPPLCPASLFLSERRSSSSPPLTPYCATSHRAVSGALPTPLEDLSEGPCRGLDLHRRKVSMPPGRRRFPCRNTLRGACVGPAPESAAPRMGDPELRLRASRRTMCSPGSTSGRWRPDGRMPSVGFITTALTGHPSVQVGSATRPYRSSMTAPATPPPGT